MNDLWLFSPKWDIYTTALISKGSKNIVDKGNEETWEPEGGRSDVKGYLIIMIQPFPQSREDTCWKCLTDGDAEDTYNYEIVFTCMRWPKKKWKILYFFLKKELIPSCLRFKCIRCKFIWRTSKPLWVCSALIGLLDSFYHGHMITICTIIGMIQRLACPCRKIACNFMTCPCFYVKDKSQSPGRDLRILGMSGAWEYVKESH